MMGMGKKWNRHPIGKWNIMLLLTRTPNASFLIEATFCHSKP
jgi:hypothetical protein